MSASAHGKRSSRPSRMAEVSADRGWVITKDDFEPWQERDVEALLTIGNGYLGTRGAVEEATPASRPATLIAGVYDAPPGDEATPTLYVAPNWLNVRVSVEGEPLMLSRGTILEHRRTLDLRRGVLHRQWRQRDPDGRITRLTTLRFASLADRHLLFHRIEVMPENYSGLVSLEVRLDGVVARRSGADPPGASGAGDAAQDETLALARTATSGISVSITEHDALRAPGDKLAAERTVSKDAEGFEATWQWKASLGQVYTLDRTLAVYTSRDVADPAEAAARHLHEVKRRDANDLLAAHTEAWARRWDSADIEVEGDDEAQLALRFGLYHLIIAGNPDDERVSIGARTLSGKAYRGHVFWDTDIFMLPFFVFTHPATARALLMYRYHTLPQARREAEQQGYRGALYAWESTVTGAETTPREATLPSGEIVPILTGQYEDHISADVAYAVWQYWRATGDSDFFAQAGAEIVLECARFWASRAVADAENRYHIRRVMGPDEYHEIVDDNAYTNGMARWTLERGVETLDWLSRNAPQRLADLGERMNLAPQEPEEWRHIAAGLVTHFDPATRLFEQFTGYFALEHIDLSPYEGRLVALDVMLGNDTIRRSQVTKQADVLMLLHLLADEFDRETLEANFRYYEPRTAHGSSLSPAIHALLAARLGDTALAKHYFDESIRIDLGDQTGSAAGGIHGANCGGLWQAIVFGVAGMKVHEDGLSFDPHLLPEWRRLRFSVLWRGQRLRVSLTPRRMEVMLEGKEEMRLQVGDGLSLPIEPGRRYQARLTQGQWSTPRGERV
jgi:trehalose/maltose hydrolase-like predicted phosphorylase